MNHLKLKDLGRMLTLLMLFSLVGAAFADKIPSPPPLADEPIEEQDYFRKLYTNIHAPEVVASVPTATPVEGTTKYYTDGTTRRLYSYIDDVWNYWDRSGTNWVIGSGEAGIDYTLTFDGEDNDCIYTFDEDNDIVSVDCEHRFGDTSNYLDIESDGTIEFNGTATVWDDMRILPGSFDRPGVADPAIVPYAPGGGGNTYLWEFAKNDIASFTIQLPHSYKQGTDIGVHIHWTPGTRGNEESGTTVGWKVDCSWANINGTFGALSTSDLSDTTVGTDHTHQMTPEVNITGTGKNISSMLLCNVKRTDTGTDDTWASINSGQLPLLMEIDFHYEIDTVGSRTESSK